MPTNAEQLMALSNLIAEAVKVIIDEYNTAGIPVPSLRSASTAPTLFDSPENVTPMLSKAIRTIEAASAQLSFTVASPGHVMTNKVYGFYEPSAIHVICNAKIADLLLDKPDGVHVSILAKESGLDEDKLSRILRMLATKHCFIEVQPDVFANNRLSIKMLSSDSVSSLLGHMADEVQKSACNLEAVVFQPVANAPPPTSIDTAFSKTHGCTMFEYFDTLITASKTKPEGKKKMDRFAKAMVGWGDVTGKGMLHKVYPWENCDPGTTVCDLGGGNGHIMLDLVNAFPNIEPIIQDLPPVVEQAKELWKEVNPSAVQTSQVRFVALDFLEDIPVSECNFYYLRHVLHDWPESDCLKILRNVRRAANSLSKLLIHEYVLQLLVRKDDHTEFEQASEPLLPNYGMGCLRLYQQDINMMTLGGSKERTLEEFIDMGKKCGFKFVKLWDSGETAVVEFVPV
ncbi:Sterigmatocystin 8-O-methyltransferase [Leucoagaricus sp. SymC.cos]|nr:Sterigmatocystin 8-O-methyltransferase [Leucoagaricus sp. SymC.cos]